MPALNKIGDCKTWVFFWVLLLLMLVINFIGGYFGLTHLNWHLFLHTGIIIFSFLVLIYSLKLNERAMEYVIFGSVMWIVINSILFLSHIFEEYIWLETNIFIFFGMIVGIFLLMFGFKEAVKQND